MAEAKTKTELLKTARSQVPEVAPSELAKELPDLQMCTEAIRQVPTGGITQPLVEWVNRPTYQQADEIQGHR